MDRDRSHITLSPEGEGGLRMITVDYEFMLLDSFHDSEF